MLRWFVSSELFHINGDQVFIKPLKISAFDKHKPCGVGHEDIDAIFSCMEIILSFNAQLYNELEKRINNWSPTQVLGDVFLTIGPYLKVYTTYVNNYNRALDTLRKLSKQGSFMKFLAV